jgi:hypothetical protein
VLHSTGRRTVFARAAAALAALRAFPAEARHRHKKKKSKKKGTKAAFILVTGCAARGGCACHACQRHAANKLFASRDAVVRAHTGCNCQVDTLSLPRGKWVALFQPPDLPATTAVDRRDPRVQGILGDH